MPTKQEFRELMAEKRRLEIETAKKPKKAKKETTSKLNESSE
jgi:hypothetical protein